MKVAKHFDNIYFKIASKNKRTILYNVRKKLLYKGTSFFKNPKKLKSLFNFREEKPSENDFTSTNGSSPSHPNPSDPDRDAKLREIVSHIYQYVSRQYNIRQMTQQPGVSFKFIKQKH
jgi:hypothetical protein